jgi:hypothetical protein
MEPIYCGALTMSQDCTGDARFAFFPRQGWGISYEDSMSEQAGAAVDELAERSEAFE